jgi:hypothetical protein
MRMKTIVALATFKQTLIKLLAVALETRRCRPHI